MNYNKVIKDLKERNDKLQEQYRLRDIRCIHLEYENEMLKGDFEAQHELTKKYAEENQELKKQLEDTNEELELVRCDLHNRTSERNGYYRNIEKLENQQKEFIEYLTSYIELLSNKPDLIEECEIDLLKEILSKYKETIGNDINVGSKGGKDER